MLCGWGRGPSVHAEPCQGYALNCNTMREAACTAALQYALLWNGWVMGTRELGCSEIAWEQRKIKGSC